MQEQLSTNLGQVGSFSLLENPLKTDNSLSNSTITTPVSQSSNLVENSWAKAITVPQSYGKAVTVDGSGNIYSTGYFRGKIDLNGDGNAEISNSDGVFIIKQNGSDGNFIWGKTVTNLTSGSISEGTGITVDVNGNVYVAGNFNTSIDFNNDGIFDQSAGNYDAFVMKLSGNDGSFLWATTAGGKFDDRSNQIAVDTSGNIYTTGTFGSSIDLDRNGTSDVGAGAFIIKQNGSDGSFIWAKSLSSSSFATGKGIAVDNNGNIYTSGEFKDSIDFNGDGQADAKGTNSFVIKQNSSDGSITWAKAIKSSQWSHNSGITVDASGNVYTIGGFNGSIDFNGDGKININGSSDIFITKQNGSDGNFAWAKSIPSNQGQGNAITVDASGNIYSTGSFRYPTDIDGDGTPETSRPGYGAFVIKQNSSNGQITWGKPIGGIGYGIAVDAMGNVYTTGSASSGVDLDRDGNIDSKGDSIFFLKMVPTLGTNDFNSDGKADYLKRNPVTGENTFLSFNDFSIAQSRSITKVPDTNWQIISSHADFNGDNQLDIVWRNIATGENAIWLMSGLGDANSDKQLITTTSTDWTMVAVDDFDGDGKDDILWHNQNTKENALWLMNSFKINPQYLNIRKISEPGWVVSDTGDFNNDGKADIIWRNTIDGRNAIWLMNGEKVQEGKYIDSVANLDWQIKGVGDVDGNGKDDIIWQNQNNGEVAVWFINIEQLNGNNFSVKGEFITDTNAQKVLVSSTWKLEVSDDFNGDGKDDLLWRNYDSDSLGLWWMNGSKLEKGDFIK